MGDLVEVEPIADRFFSEGELVAARGIDQTRSTRTGTSGRTSRFARACPRSSSVVHDSRSTCAGRSAALPSCVSPRSHAPPSRRRLRPRRRRLHRSSRACRASCPSPRPPPWRSLPSRSRPRSRSQRLSWRSPPQLPPPPSRRSKTAEPEPAKARRAPPPPAVAARRQDRAPGEERRAARARARQARRRRSRPASARSRSTRPTAKRGSSSALPTRRRARTADARRCYTLCLKEGKRGPLGECRAMIR